jgi:predicted nucleic acid-binding protein
VLARPDLHLVIPALVVGEVAFRAGTRSGPRAEAAVLRSLRDSDVEAPTPADYERMAELVEEYADFPLGAVDASVIALAERLDTDVVVTLDRRHFGAVRPRHRDALTLLPG